MKRQTPKHQALSLDNPSVVQQSQNFIEQNHEI